MNIDLLTIAGGLATGYSVHNLIKSVERRRMRYVVAWCAALTATMVVFARRAVGL